MVYVLNKNGNPLMPTKNFVKVRILLKQGKAKVVSRYPFTIQLTYNTSNYVQLITLGVDAGRKHIGFSATTKTDVLFEAICEEYTETHENLKARKILRGVRRSRKTRYRPPRFNNRKTKKKGWLSPTILHIIQTHETMIAKIHKILPIFDIVVEIAKFDIYKIKNPEVYGKEYQEGEMKDFANIREFILHRDNYTCRCCKGKSGDKKLHVHHIIFRCMGGSNSPLNLILLCETCHKALHRGEITLSNRIIKKISFTDASYMNTMKDALINSLKEKYPTVGVTYGYETKLKRFENNLPKEHYIDARCISGNPTAKPLGYYYLYKKLRCHDRQIHFLTVQRGGVCDVKNLPFEFKGFRMFDRVLFNKEEWFIYGRRANGSFELRKLNSLNKGTSRVYKKLKLIEKRRNTVCQKVCT